MNRTKELKLYAKIREENRIKYGTDINRYGPTLLEKQYRDRTYFIYELIQNAEDACERVRKKGRGNQFYLFFNLFLDRLEILHNGIPFTEKDVRGICGIVESTKSRDYSQIGKFGIGFKSVIAYTKSPIILSRDTKGDSYYFTIKDYVHPHAADMSTILNDLETKIIIPFNHNEVSNEVAYNEIQERLSKLGSKTILFLTNISDISWKVYNRQGKYLKNTENIKNYRLVELINKNEKRNQEREHWLVYSDSLSETEKNAKVEIAYKIKILKEGKKQIIPAPFSELYVYFSTRKETHLNFIIQGPYQTTIGRDNIRKMDWNTKLVDKTKDLLIKSFDSVKNLGLFDVSFLQTLPINTEYFRGPDHNDDIMFKNLYFAVKDKLQSDTAYLPKYDSGHVTASNALMGGTKEIRELLSKEQLAMYYNKENMSWLDETITYDRTPDLREYLMSELNVPEMTADMFARRFSLKFIQKQSDEWVSKFYRLLSNQKALWREKNWRYNEGLLRSKPFIRLQDKTHTAPFNNEGEPIAFLPSKGYEGLFPIIKHQFCEDQEIKKFFLELGLNEPDRISAIELHVFPLYNSESSEVSQKENVVHIKWIINTIKNTDSQFKKTIFIEKIKKHYLLFARNGEGKTKYKKPLKVYLGSSYSNNSDVEVFSAGNENTWLLDNRYNKITSSDLTLLGCSNEIKIKYTNPSFHGIVTVSSGYGWHVRGLNGFDPNFSIDGLDFTLETITYEKALIIWNIIKLYPQSIYGVTESSTNQDYKAPKAESKFSVVGNKLVRNSWLPNGRGDFFKPNEMLLSDLPKDFEPNNAASNEVAEKLQFKPDIDKKILDLVPEEKRSTVNELLGLTDDENEVVLDFIQKLKFKRTMAEESSLQDIQQQLLDEVGLETTKLPRKPPEPKKWTGLTPEEEKEFGEKYGESLPKRWDELSVQHKTHVSTDKKIIDIIHPKEFLYAMYGGCCQICNTILNAGSPRPIFSVFRIIKKTKHPSANMEWNVLGLCPNCHALLTFSLKYNTGSLRNIFVFAEMVHRGYVVSEPVRERSGDYYIVDIILAGNEAELYYRPEHMQSLVKFLYGNEDYEALSETRTDTISKIGEYRKKLRGE